MNEQISNSTVYVDTDALLSWNTEMNQINESAISILDSITTTINELDNYWVGNSATGFKKATTALLTKAKKSHTEMKNAGNFLTEVVNTMENE